uniref:MULE transposase domain-containing protein n=1 Tax=Lactuca sativa TaxID=4236 RepID=A0A9R1UJ27_LACSA|nr:hypothetical protein LSAT_V11C900459490 [Lactuca sativa]
MLYFQLRMVMSTRGGSGSGSGSSAKPIDERLHKFIATEFTRGSLDATPMIFGRGLWRSWKSGSAHFDLRFPWVRLGLELPRSGSSWRAKRLSSLGLRTPSLAIAGSLTWRILSIRALAPRRPRWDSPAGKGVQTTETVAEIMAKFREKSFLVPQYVADEEMKKMRYHAMLRDDIREYVSFPGCKTMNDMIKKAREREIELELRTKLKPEQRLAGSGSLFQVWQSVHRGNGSEGSGDDSDDSEYNVDKPNIQFDVNVDMSEFHNAVDVDEHGILNNHSKDEGSDMVDDELEVIATDDYQFVGFHEDDRKRLLKDLSKSSTCSHGKVHVKPFQIGQVFKTKCDVKNYMNSHVVEAKRSLYLAKNDKIRIRVKCKGVVSKPSKVVDGGGASTRSRAKCKGKDGVQISRANENQDWLVKTVQDEHKCLQTRAIKACTSRYVAKLIVQQIQSNPRIPVKALHEELCKKLELGMLLAKTMAGRIISGDYQVQYGFLRDYVLELLNTNPSTTVRIDVYPETSLSITTRTLRRIYVCLGALKLGFKAGLRDFLGWMGPYPGQVLTVVGLDSNNGIYPVAYAVVETESTSSWTWFLELLGEDLDLGANSNFTFISDRQKGIILATEKVFPSAEHRFCLRHIQENMKKQWKGKDLSDQLWECGRATTVNHFNRVMDELKKINEEDHAWVCKISTSTWAKSHFSVRRAHADCLLNNLCEYIMEHLMKRLCVVKKEIDKCEGLLTPTATTMFEKIKTDAAKYVAKYNGTGKYQVAST